MLLEIGMKVIHPLYPQWGEGTVVDFVESDPVIQFEERAGRPAPFSLENLQDQDGHSLARLIPKPLTKAQLRAEAKARAEAAKIEKEEQEKAQHEEAIMGAVTYLVSLGDRVTLCIAQARTQDEADELVSHCARYGLDLRIEVRPNRWGSCIRLVFPVLPDNPPPFPVCEVGKAGFRCHRNRLMPQALLCDKDEATPHFRLCNTEVALQLIEKGLRYKETQLCSRG